MIVMIKMKVMIMMTRMSKTKDDNTIDDDDRKKDDDDDIKNDDDDDIKNNDEADKMWWCYVI